MPRLCVKCGKRPPGVSLRPRVKPKTCGKCRAQARAHMVAYRMRKPAGECASCSRPPAPGGVTCATCRARPRRLPGPIGSLYESLVRHGVPVHAAFRRASALAAPTRRCVICGIPNWRMWRFKREHRWIPGGVDQHWTRLHIDRFPRGLRLLCYLCNRYRGDGLHSDDAVYRHSLRFWRRYFSDRYLRWLYRSLPSERRGPGKDVR